MKVKQARKILEENGWMLARHGKGDHDIYTKEGVVNNVALDGKPSDDIPVGTLSGMRKTSGIEALR